MFSYRKKPVVIQAFQWTGGPDQEGEPDWIIEAIKEGSVTFDKRDGALHIQTLEGVMKVTQNDYIIKGIAGELYPCKPEIFEQTYEKVEE